MSRKDRIHRKGADYSAITDPQCFIFGMRSIIIAILLYLLVDTSVSFKVMSSGGPVVAHLGSSVTLPCWISPAESVEDMDIRWYRSEQFGDPVLLYQHGKIQDTVESFKNRSFLTVRSDLSGGLKGGDVSLRLDNLTVQDGDVFHCYVSGDKTYNSAEVELKITASGSAPVLFPKPLDDGQLKVSCRSSGWYPKPNITWMLDNNQPLGPGVVSYGNGLDGLFSVQSWMTVFPSDAQLVSCSVSTTTGELKEGRIDIQALVSSDSSNPWMALFFTLLVLVLLSAVGLFLIHKYRDKLPGKKADETDAENRLVEREKADINIEDLRKHGELITIDGENISPALKVSKDCTIVRDSPEYSNNEKLFSYGLCAVGAQVFSSGRHYWEVELAAPPKHPKEFWLVGVMKHGQFHVEDRPDLSPSNGFWFLSSDGANGFYSNTDPPIKLSLSPRPERLGVLLDYDGGLLSFYSIKESKHLLTMKTTFSGPVVPLFNPGVGDISPLKILDVSPKDEESPPEVSQPLLPNSSSKDAEPAEANKI